MQEIFLLLRNDFKIDQYALGSSGRTIHHSFRDTRITLSLLALIKDNSFWRYSTLLNNLGPLLL